MNRLNSRLLTIFLLLGIIFFGAVLFFIVKEALGESNNKHSIQIEQITIVKNTLLDTARMSAERNRYREPGEFPGTCTFEFTSLNDSMVYYRSAPVDLAIAEAPVAVNSYEKQVFLQSTIDHHYRVTTCKPDPIIFEPVNFSKALQLDEKSDNATEYRDVRLESIDKKLVIVINFRVD
jgi:hypothetical protein